MASFSSLMRENSIRHFCLSGVGALAPPKKIKQKEKAAWVFSQFWWILGVTLMTCRCSAGARFISMSNDDQKRSDEHEQQDSLETLMGAFMKVASLGCIEICDALFNLFSDTCPRVISSPHQQLLSPATCQSSLPTSTPFCSMDGRGSCPKAARGNLHFWVTLCRVAKGKCDPMIY